MRTIKATSKSTSAPDLSQIGEMVSERVADLREQAAELAGEAAERLAPLVDEARTKLPEYVEQAREKGSTYATTAKAAAVPAVTAATAATTAKARGLAEQAGLVEPPKKTHRLRNLLVLVGLGGLVAFVVKKRGEQTPTWHSTYSPTTPGSATAGAGTSGRTGGLHAATPAATPAGGSAPTDDPGGAGPDEAAADEAETPHVPTTPDNPAEEVVLDPDRKV